MIQSMTGFGQAAVALGSKTVHVEIKSLNSKNMDISTRMSSMFNAKDLEIRAMIANSLLRGKVDFTLWIEDSQCVDGAVLNKEIIHAYIEQIKAISREEGISEPQEWWPVVSKMPNVAQQQSDNTVSDELWACVQQAVTEALGELQKFRAQEGVAVKSKFEEKLRNIAQYLQEVEQYETLRVEKIRAHITESLKSIKDMDYDQNRLEQEMIFYIEKLDVSEEKQRLTNHLAYFADTLNQDGSLGKKLGFIAQEMGREINTLGSKSNLAEMQNLVVKMKDELEQIKEQVLNVL